METIPQSEFRHPHYDALIVGAGPSGNMAALLLARAGWRVLLIERKKFPRAKVCGDCINPKATEFWRRHGLSEAFDALPQARPPAIHLEWLGKRQVTLPVQSQTVVERALLDDWLLGEARNAGAEIWEETTLLERLGKDAWKTSRGDVQARVLIGADGRNSHVARIAGLARGEGKENPVRIGWMANLSLPSDEAIHMGAFENGYYGFAPHPSGETHACFVLPPGLHPDAVAPRFLPGAEKVEWQNITPLTRAPFEPCADGVYLVGDAYRVLEPFTGEGIWHAVQSGAAVAEALLEANDSVQAERLYRAKLQTIYGSHLAVNSLSRWVLSEPKRAGGLFRAFRRFPSLARVLFQWFNPGGLTECPPAATEQSEVG
jgi:flavin-dependent dehydrogenase